MPSKLLVQDLKMSRPNLMLEIVLKLLEKTKVIGTFMGLEKLLKSLMNQKESADHLLQGNNILFKDDYLIPSFIKDLEIKLKDVEEGTELVLKIRVILAMIHTQSEEESDDVHSLSLLTRHAITYS